MSKVDIKIITCMNNLCEIALLDAAVASVMQPYQKAALSNAGTVLDTLQREPQMVAALGCDVTVESYQYLDTYPGTASMWGYGPNALVLNRR